MEIKPKCELCGCDLEMDETKKHPGYCRICNELKNVDIENLFEEEIGEDGEKIYYF